jgi:ARG/rhodanese/phosphatase superfamily protein
MDTNRRQFLLGSSIGAVGAIAAPAWAWADRLRVLDEPAEVDGPVGGSQVNPAFQHWMGAARVGQAVAHGGLLVFWFNAKEQAPALDVVTLDEARKSGALLITERDQATVPELVVENRGKIHVLLLAGEILVGGKQNRVLREDILLPPLSGARPIGVYCVEQGRWNEALRVPRGRKPRRGPPLRGVRRPHRHPLAGLDRQQLDFEDERGAGRDDVAGAALTVAEVRRNDELTLAARLHRAHALVPALDHAALADRKLEGLAAVHRAVELLAALEPPRVVHADRLARPGPGAGTLDDIDVLEARSRLDGLLVHGGSSSWRAIIARTMPS